MVLQLYYVEELNVYEIGEILSVSTGRVSQIKSAAIKKLKSLSIFEYCNKEHDSMTSLYDWTEVINKECNYEQKCMIIGFMWDIAFIDSKIDKYEDFTIRKVADLIYVKHKDFIALKNDRAT